MLFPLGKPILIMALISIIAGGWLLAHRPEPPADLTLWTFSTGQFHDYSDLEPIFRQQTGKSVHFDLVTMRAMDMRLPIVFMSPGKSRELPDLVEVQLGSIGMYLRPPAEQIGFLPLNSYLQNSGIREIASLNDPGQRGWNARLKTDGLVYTFDGTAWKRNPAQTRPDAWIDRILPSRFTSSTKSGQIYGLPHDVHPVALAFREDLFRQAGVPLMDASGRSTVTTWPQFQDACLRFMEYWRSHGEPTRHAIELPVSNSEILSILLAQRHIDLVDPDFASHLNDPKVAQTLAFYVQLVAGDRKIGTDTQFDTAVEYKDFAEGHLCSLLMPDWKVDAFRRFAPDLAGKMRLIPLPVFDPIDAPTASYGATLLCIPRGSPHPDDAWRLAEFLYLSPASLADRTRLGIIPPLPEVWGNPEYHQPDPWFGGQKSLELYIDLAKKVPPVHLTPVNKMALLTLAYVQSWAVAYVKSHGPDGLEPYCQKLLDSAERDLQRRIQHVRFDE